MNILLLNPKLKTWSPNVYFPLGLGYIASVLEKDGHNIRIIDMNSNKIPDRYLINSLEYIDLVGITGMITEYNEVVRISRLILDNSSAPIILGGPLATTWTEKVLRNSGADIAVLGEGEKTIVELVKDIKNLNNIKGIAYYESGSVKINEAREPIGNLDELPFPSRNLVDMSKYTTHHFKSFGMKTKDIKSATMITSRGCPYGCIFCFKDIWGKKWRGRSAPNIVDEIKELNKLGYNGFVFNDDTFVVDKRRVVEFCNLVQPLDINWYCNGRVNLMDESLIFMMKHSGCIGIAYGIESGNQEILDFIKKGITLDQISKIIALTKKYGIHVTGYFMIGMLGETKETIRQTLDFARKLDLNFYGFGITTPMEGTELYSMASSQGLLNRDQLEDWSLKGVNNLTKDCTMKELEHFNEEAFREFTLEKRYGKRYLWNPMLWIQGLRSLLFLIRKRNVKMLVRKVWITLRRK